MENNFRDDFGTFSGSFLENGQLIQFGVSPEIIIASAAILPVRRFVVEVQHPQRTPFVIIIQQNELCDWDCKQYPEVISDEFIENIGVQIEYNTSRFYMPLMSGTT